METSLKLEIHLKEQEAPNDCNSELFAAEIWFTADSDLSIYVVLGVVFKHFWAWNVFMENENKQKFIKTVWNRKRKIK